MIDLTFRRIREAEADARRARGVALEMGREIEALRRELATTREERDLHRAIVEALGDAMPRAVAGVAQRLGADRPGAAPPLTGQPPRATPP